MGKLTRNRVLWEGWGGASRGPKGWEWDKKKFPHHARRGKNGVRQNHARRGRKPHPSDPPCCVAIPFSPQDLSGSRALQLQFVAFECRLDQWQSCFGNEYKLF